MYVLPNLTLRELVNYGRPLVPPVDSVGHAPTMQERIENDSNEGWYDWTEHRQPTASQQSVGGAV